MGLTLSKSKIILAFLVIAVINIGCEKIEAEKKSVIKKEVLIGSAQSFKFSPAKKIELNGTTNEKKTVTNQTYIIGQKDTVNLVWRLLEAEYPNKWHVYICDNELCHMDVPDSNLLKPITKETPIKKRRMKLYLDHFGKSGTGQVLIELADTENYSDKDTITFQLAID